MIEEYPSSRSELDASRFSLQQLHAELLLEIAHLSAQRRLRGVQPPLGGVPEAAFLGDRNEIA